MKKIFLLLLVGLSSGLFTVAQKNIDTNLFRQLGQELPTPNVYHTASGAPGYEYWQQQADYDIDLRLDDEKQRIYGEETVTYTNNSPDVLDYLWIQLDQNIRSLESDAVKVKSTRTLDRVGFNALREIHFDFDGGFKLDYVQDVAGKDLDYTINNTMMRIELPKAMKKGDKFSFKVKWWYNINDRMQMGGRSGYEYFEKDDNYLYTIAQFYPRMCVYSDVEGWQHKQFLGRGEFALTFGNYEVDITVPADHLVAATGELQNSSEILSPEILSKLDEAKNTQKQVIIVDQETATKNESSRSKDTKTWKFKAENVRDFGFASSRKFIWDAQGVPFGDRTVMAMSYYPKEGNPLWEEYSTKSIVQTLKTYSKHTFDYPYPVAISVNAAEIGMEYPMICFNWGRCEEDGSYSDRVKFATIGVIIHEIGHNYFPMIVNSDERKWAWMDEGLNTFCQYLTEKEFMDDFPSRRGPANKIVDYMKGNKANISPIMADPAGIWQLGPNAYGKPATALNILRETVMGHDLFDYAFKEYSNRWMFKHPTPADFFRTMEDASGVDLDWFWRGWFYSTDHVDLGVVKSRVLKIGDVVEAAEEEEVVAVKETKKSKKKKKKKKNKVEEVIEEIVSTDPFPEVIIPKDRFMQYVGSNMSESELEYIEEGYNYYQINFENKGGLVMPLIIEFEFEDGTKEIQRIPVQIFKTRNTEVSKLFAFKKNIKTIRLDPFEETADVDVSNNVYPKNEEEKESKFDEFKKTEN